MNKVAILFVLIASFGLAQARDTVVYVPISEALNTSDFKEKLDPSIQFFFAGQTVPKIKEKMPVFVSNKKTNAFNKSDDEACRWVFLSAMISLQERAIAEGGNAVIDIESFYKKSVHRSTETVECHAGNIMAGVALKGRVVKL